MGNKRDSLYGYNVWHARLNDVRSTGIDIQPKSTVEIGPGRNLAASISALIDGAEVAIAVDGYKYASMGDNQNIYDELIKISGKNESTSLRNKIKYADNNNNEFVLKYIAPCSDYNAISKNSVDFIFSLSVMEHIDDPYKVYDACYKWLKPGGVMCHKIDYSSHGITKTWNSHYWIPEHIWKLIRGKRSYLINRLPPFEHLNIMKSLGFTSSSINIIYENENTSKIYNIPVNNKFNSFDKKELFIKTSTIIAVKP